MTHSLWTRCVGEDPRQAVGHPCLTVGCEGQAALVPVIRVQSTVSYRMGHLHVSPLKAQMTDMPRQFGRGTEH